jgi:signal transduction histidine kinase
METTRPNPETSRAAVPALGRALQPGVVLLGGGGEPQWADDRALALLGCRDSGELAARWPAIRQRLPQAAGSSAELPDAIELPPEVTGGRQVQVSLVQVAGTAAGADAGAGAKGNGLRPAALLVQDAEIAAALESDLRAASQMRSLAQIAPAVAHDLRAPINAMVLNLEVLKETLAAGVAGALPAQPPRAYGPAAAGRDPRERQQRYVSVLREELSRLHQSLELFLAHISPRGDRLETLDLRGPAQDLAALLRPTAHKQQVKIEVLLPEAAVPVLAQRHQLRQALLHLGLAALEQVPRDGKLQIRLDRLPAPPRARLRIAAAPLLGGPDAPPSPPAALPQPEIEPRFSAAGIEARLSVARGILSSLGGTSRPVSSGVYAPAAIAGADRVGGAAGLAGPNGQGALQTPGAQTPRGPQGPGGSLGPIGPQGPVGAQKPEGAQGPGGPSGPGGLGGQPAGEPAAFREIPAFEIEFPTLESLN